jgi:hypothetical protein
VGPGLLRRMGHPTDVGRRSKAYPVAVEGIVNRKRMKIVYIDSVTKSYFDVIHG